MTSDHLIAAALETLAGIRHPHADAIRLVPKEPGLYAFYGDDRAWDELGLSPAFEGQPLYVGKAEKSLNGRDVGTHFAAGKTGSSTVRRSLAALLVVVGARIAAHPVAARAVDIGRARIRTPRSCRRHSCN